MITGIRAIPPAYPLFRFAAIVAKRYTSAGRQDDPLARPAATEIPVGYRNEAGSSQSGPNTISVSGLRFRGACSPFRRSSES